MIGTKQKTSVLVAPISVKWNKKDAITRFLRNFAVKFDMKDDAIDLREMSKNYARGIIPLEDVRQALLTVLGPSYADDVSVPHDASGSAIIHYPESVKVNPRFGYVSWEDMYVWSLFQRDVIPNHILKLLRDWNNTCAIVPCAIRITLNTGEKIYCIWDGHHTIHAMKQKGYTKFPMWYIDLDCIADEEIENAGFSLTDEDRIKYGAFLAGTNMRMINNKNKRPLSPYDDFLIGLETRDPQCMSMMNILKKNNCVVKRSADSIPGAFTQFKTGIECYELDNGVSWDRALRLHRKYWPAAPLELEVFRPLTLLFHRATLEGFKLDSNFEKEFMTMIINEWGDANNVHMSIKESFDNALHEQRVAGVIPEQNKILVLAGMINFYKQNSGKTLLPHPTCQWRV